MQTKHSRSDTVLRVTSMSISIELDQELLDRLDQRAAREDRSRSALIGDAIESHLPDETLREGERERISREIAEGYERVPETEEELSAARTRTRLMIEEEPW